MIKRLYSQSVALLCLVCYIIIFIHISLLPANSLRYSFGLALSILNLLAIAVELLYSAYFIEGGTLEDVYFRQRTILIIAYTLLFTVATVVTNNLWYIGPFLLQFAVTFHRSLTNPEVLHTLLDIVLLVIWIVFLVELYK